MTRANRVIGIDFDNTIVCYDRVFHCEAVRRGWVPSSLPATKGAVRAHLHAHADEQAWTLLQGHVYGHGIREAEPYPGALEFLGRCAREGVRAHVISHKTRHPVRGPAVDLHAAALDWLSRHGVLGEGAGRLGSDRVHFAPTRRDKLRKIREVGCTAFIDDLPDVFTEPGFPSGVERFLFAPTGQSPRSEFRAASTWSALEVWMLDGLEERRP
jgi:hypothetical protein